MTRPPSLLLSTPWAGLLTFALTACSGEGLPPNLPDPPLSVADTGCSPLFYQERLPDYRVTIAPAEWDALMAEFLNRPDPEFPDLVLTPYHPIEFECDGEKVPNTLLRLKGDSSWWQAITLDEHPKMQFVIAFNEVEKDGRFYGVRKVELDMPRDDESFLRQRLSLYYLRNAGVTAQCANNARLYINGEYYGLYTNLERLDKEFLQRHYGDEDDGDLWKAGRDIKTNEETFSPDRIDWFWEARSLADLEPMADLTTSVKVWAHDAMIPNEDGYYNGHANFYLYDHPSHGFTWIPHDLDGTFDYIPPSISPMYPDSEFREFSNRIHWALVMGDEGWLAAYRDDLATAWEAYGADQLETLVLDWADQIEQAAAEDPMKPFLQSDHDYAVGSLAEFPHQRAAVVAEWLDCFRAGGADSDGDGFSFCNDCDDSDALRNPDAPERCNGYDDNCNGQTDETEGGVPCM